MEEMFLSKNGSTNNNVKDEPTEEFECDLCNFKTQEDIELITHFQTEHSEQVEVKQEKDEEEILGDLKENFSLQDRQQQNNPVKNSYDINFETKNYKEIKREIDKQKLPLLQLERVKYFNCEYCDKLFEHKLSNCIILFPL